MFQAGLLTYCTCCPDPASSYCFRFKVFADYEAYIQCQAQVDHLYRVRFVGHQDG